MKLPPYPKYKPSGVEWLGDVPEHWEVKRLKYLTEISTSGVWGDDPDSENDGYPIATTANISPQGEIDLPGMHRRLLSKEEFRKGRCRPGDTIVVKSSGSASSVVSGKCAMVRPEHGEICYSNFTLRVRPIESLLHPFFTWSFLSSGIVRAQVRLMVSTTTYPNLQVPEPISFLVPLPPPAEQRSIAGFLNRETGRVDRLVAKKRELIERLKEKRTALISRTVTRGLPPAVARAAGLPADPPLKASGFEWLGEIPKHWRVMALKWRSRCRSGDSIATDEVTLDPTPERSIPVIGGNGVMGYCERSNCDQPVLVVGRVGALCGNVHQLAPPAWIADNALVMPTDSATFSQEYLAAVLRTRNLNELADKTAQPLITGTRVRNERVPVPPLPEQAAIAAYLDAETAKLDALVGKVEEAIERLQKYRTALITAAVTGKIDARDKSYA